MNNLCKTLNTNQIKEKKIIGKNVQESETFIFLIQF